MYILFCSNSVCYVHTFLFSPSPPLDCNSDPGVTNHAFLPPVPTRVRAYIFTASKFQTFVPSSTRIVVIQKTFLTETSYSHRTTRLLAVLGYVPGHSCRAYASGSYLVRTTRLLEILGYGPG